jgi:hypothetical protein
LLEISAWVSLLGLRYPAKQLSRNSVRLLENFQDKFVRKLSLNKPAPTNERRSLSHNQNCSHSENKKYVQYFNTECPYSVRIVSHQLIRYCHECKLSSKIHRLSHVTFVCQTGLLFFFQPLWLLVQTLILRCCDLPVFDAQQHNDSSTEISTNKIK